MKRRTKKERTEDLILIADLWVKGCSYREIANHLGSIRNYKLCFSTICNDVKAIIVDWKKKREFILTDRVSIELKKSFEREKILWESWENSQKPIHKSIAKKQNPSCLKSMELNDESGYFKFMELMLNEADFRCRLLGAYPKKWKNLNANTKKVVIVDRLS